MGGTPKASLVPSGAIPNDGPLSFGEVLKAELDEIGEVREKKREFTTGEQRDPVSPPLPLQKQDWQTKDPDWVETIRRSHDANLVGLALSGGGIRSATFNLGVLQALAELKLLTRFDYLSTVSGGGYIGGWLAAWIKRAKSIGTVQDMLAPYRVNQPEDREPTEIRFLRIFSNYLTPKLGIFSGDTWAAAAIVLRNILLNQVIILAALVAVLLMPRVLVQWASYLAGISLHFSALPVLLLMGIALTIISANMVYVDRGTGSWLCRQGGILGLVGIPIFLSSIIGAIWPKATGTGWSQVVEPIRSAHWGMWAYLLLWLLAVGAGPAFWKLWRKWQEKGRNIANFYTPWDDRGVPILLIAAAPCGALAAWLYATAYFDRWSDKTSQMTYGVPIVLGIVLLTGTLHLGLMGTAFRDWRREWWGRLGGFLLLGGLLWLAVFWVVLKFPDFINPPPRWLAGFEAKYFTLAWLASTISGVLMAKGDATGKPGQWSWKELIPKAAPYIFAVGLVCWVSYGIERFLRKLQSPGASGNWQWLRDHVPSGSFTLYAALGCAALAVLMARRVDINQFSMHLFYRNRLVGCYLGASNRKRSPNRFTGLDASDDVPLKDFTAKGGYDGPYPIVNAALNLVEGQDLAWQERKAESFVMTPLYCGYDVWLEEQDTPITRRARALSSAQLKQERLQAQKRGPGQYRQRLERFGYRPTDQYAFPPPKGKGPLLGLAMGTSGAAASPNMGFYSSGPVAFLMTVFNVRLGQWLGNPRHKRTWRYPTPKWGFTYLLKELFAGTDDESAYVYLSDGGHFDNMGLYELVKRRCGLIVLCDAEADANYEYRGLGNAIRKCRIDLGIDIDINLKELTPAKAGEPGKKHYAIGTIHYENADVDAPTGTILYFKASLTGDEPSDVKDYHAAHPAFPHDSTTHQWFTESQFESYRKLGYHAVYSSMQAKVAPPEPPMAAFAKFVMSAKTPEVAAAAAAGGGTC